MRGASRAVALVAAVLLLAAGSALALDVPFLSGHVVDEAGIVPPETAARLEQKLTAYEQRTGHQVAVLTVPSLDGEPLEDYTMRVAETWKLGRAAEDDGVLLFIARDDRQMRLEVGYGLEPQLTDLASRRVLDDVVRPHFRAGDYGGGIEAGVDAVIAVLDNGAEALPAAQPEQPIQGVPWPMRILMGALFFGVVGVFSLSALGTDGCGGWFLYLFLVPFYLAFPSALIHPLAGPVAAGIWLLAFPLLRAVFGKRHRPKWLTAMASQTHGGRRGGFFGGFGGFGGGGGGGFSGGGFSGGGGSFGGGGASSGW